MDALEPFLDQYGLAAIFVLPLVKAIGLPVPVPADPIMLAAAARASTSRQPYRASKPALPAQDEYPGARAGRASAWGTYGATSVP